MAGTAAATVSSAGMGMDNGSVAMGCAESAHITAAGLSAGLLERCAVGTFVLVVDGACIHDPFGQLMLFQPAHFGLYSLRLCRPPCWLRRQQHFL